MATAVILLSDKRSGSTILQSELCKHADINHVVYSPHTYFETHHWLKGAVMLDQSGALYSQGRPYEGYGTKKNAEAYMVETLTRNVPGYEPPQDAKELVFGGWEALCAELGKPVFFEKSPQILAEWAALSLMMQWMQQTDVTVKIIGLVRNPLAVQYSAHELFSTEAESRQFAWLAIQRNLLAVRAMVPAESFQLVRYEDMIAEPGETFGKMCDFIGVDRDPAIGSEVHATSKEKWRSNPDYTLQLDPAVAQISRVFGYSDAELQNPNKPSARKQAAMRPTLSRRARLGAVRLRDKVVRPLYLRFKSKT